MTDVEMLVREQLSGLDPLPPTLSADWDDVLSRIQRPAPRERLRIRPRRLALAVAVTAILFAIASIATPLGAAIERGFGDFSNWISGSPGTPVPPEAQQKFERQNEHSWDGNGFPKGTQLRELLRTEAAGLTFTLRGFRSGDSFCLRLTVRGDAGGDVSSCVPISVLQQAKQPAFVISADNDFGEVGEPPNMRMRASATFGIASDGVKDVIVSTDDGVGHALVGGNAFLYVAYHPTFGTSVQSVKAIAADGSTVALPLAVWPVKGRPVRGPKGIERKVKGGTIGWLERHEKRGTAIPPDSRPEYDVRHNHVVFAREIQPDPANTTKFVLALAKSRGKAPLPGHVPTPGREMICKGYYPAGGGADFSCSYASHVFARGPIGNLETGDGEFAFLNGFVSDDVHALDLYLTDGTIQKLKITDNIYATTLSQALFPIRIIARDKQGAIIGNQVIENP